MAILPFGKLLSACKNSLETIACDHFTCAAGDLYGDGRLHLVTGSFSLTEGRKLDQAVTVWSPK